MPPKDNEDEPDSCIFPNVRDKKLLFQDWKDKHRIELFFDYILSVEVNYESKDMLKYKNIQGNSSESRKYTFDIIKRSELIKTFLSMRNLHITTETTVFESYF